MDCKTAERCLTEQLDGRLSDRRRCELETHLAACADCRTFEEQLMQLDSALSHAIDGPSLSSEFVQRLQARITTEASSWSVQERLTRKRRLQDDFEAAIAKLNRKKLDLAELMNWVGLATLGGLGAWLVWQTTPPLITWLAGGGLTPDVQTVLRSLLPSVVFLLGGLAAAFPASTRRLRSWLEA